MCCRSFAVAAPLDRIGVKCAVQVYNSVSVVTGSYKRRVATNHIESSGNWFKNVAF